MELELGVWSDASQTEREMRYDFTYMQYLKKKIIQMNLFTKQRQTHRLRKWTYGFQRGRGKGRAKLGVWD